MRFNTFLWILYFCLLNPLYAKSDFTLSGTVQNTYPEKILILEDYTAFMKKVSSIKDLHVRLEKVNTYVNALVPKYDDKGSIGDYWATRLEFLTGGGGDCEDYAITKYQSLIDLGFKQKNMGFCIAKDSYSGTMHMVLGVFKNTKIWILDNLSFRVLPYEKRKDLIFYGCLSEETETFINMQKNSNEKMPRYLHQKYKKLIKKIENEKFWQ